MHVALSGKGRRNWDLARGGVENKHSSDVESTNRVRVFV
jgi:hypothetical protein